MTDTAMVGATGGKICDWAGCTGRQLDYWARTGTLGDTLRSPGSGGRRRWMPVADAVWACARLSELGASTHVLAIAAPVVLERRVADGEILVVTVDGPTGTDRRAPGQVTVCRFDRWCIDSTLDRCAYVVPLRSFAGEVSAPPAGDGRHRSAAVAPALST